MARLFLGIILAILFSAPLAADDRPTRADQLKSLREDHRKARDEFAKGVRDGSIQRNADGEYPSWEASRQRLASQARELIDADPGDAVGRDAIAFILLDLGLGDTNANLYQLALKHHAASEKIEPILKSYHAPVDFLRALADESPHSTIRLWAKYCLSAKLYAEGHRKEAEALSDAVARDDEAKKIGGYTGSLADTANCLLFEIQRINVGQEVPEIEGTDLNGKPMKLTEYRGKVTLLVFWAVWCKPCMDMIPRERALLERFAGRPFAIVGVNGDLPPGNGTIRNANGEEIDPTPQIMAAVKKHKIEWRSFRDGQIGVSEVWNVRSWPSVFLIDHTGIIRGKWSGGPDEDTLASAVEELVKAAESENDKAKK